MQCDALGFLLIKTTTESLRKCCSSVSLTDVLVWVSTWLTWSEYFGSSRQDLGGTVRAFKNAASREPSKYPSSVSIIWDQNSRSLFLRSLQWKKKFCCSGILKVIEEFIHCTCVGLCNGFSFDCIEAYELLTTVVLNT